MQELLSIWPAYDAYLQGTDARQMFVFEPLHGFPPTFGSRH
jgi:hypothetical protein